MHEKLIEILAEEASPEAVRWLEDQVASQHNNFQQRAFYYAFSGVSRHFDRRAKVAEVPGSPPPNQLQVSGWDEFRLARVILLLALAEQEEPVFLGTVRALLNTADIRETVAIFSAMPLLPAHPDLIEAMIDGLRSNIVDIFDAIALDNPFPSTHFPDEPWNQMVLKAIFIDRPLYRIAGLGSRRNRSLAEAISDLAHERWAAGRTITPEAWQNVVGFVSGSIRDDIGKIADSSEPLDRDAAALVLAGEASGSPDPLRETLAPEFERIEKNELSWEKLGRTLEKRKSPDTTAPADLPEGGC